MPPFLRHPFPSDLLPISAPTHILAHRNRVSNATYKRSPGTLPRYLWMTPCDKQYPACIGYDVRQDTYRRARVDVPVWQKDTLRSERHAGTSCRPAAREADGACRERPLLLLHRTDSLSSVFLSTVRRRWGSRYSVWLVDLAPPLCQEKDGVDVGETCVSPGEVREQSYSARTSPQTRHRAYSLALMRKMAYTLSRFYMPVNDTERGTLPQVPGN